MRFAILTAALLLALSASNNCNAAVQLPELQCGTNKCRCKADAAFQIHIILASLLHNPKELAFYRQQVVLLCEKHQLSVAQAKSCWMRCRPAPIE